MNITIKTTVSNCAECPMSATNSSMHDDPFTSTPELSHYVCQASGGPDFIWHEKARKEIHPKCPKREKEVD